MKIFNFFLLLLFVSFLLSCSNSKNSDLPSIQIEYTNTADALKMLFPVPVFEYEDTSPEPDELLEPDAEVEEEKPILTLANINPLTGLYIGEELAKQRPLGISINNSKQALPHYAINSGDIWYECLIEGVETRILMIVQDWQNLEMIGPVRSGREYFMKWSQAHGGYYAHFGASMPGFAYIRSSGIMNLNGLNDGLSDCFWDDPTRKRTVGLEHSHFTSSALMLKAIGRKKYSFEHEQAPAAIFKFLDEPAAPLEAFPASSIKVSFSSSRNPVYNYDPENGVYIRSQLGELHWDEAAQAPLTTTNVVIIFTDITAVPNNAQDLINVRTTGTGSGYYFSMGSGIAVKWERNTDNDYYRLFDLNGNEINVSPGKTFFNIVSGKREAQCSFE